MKNMPTFAKMKVEFAKIETGKEISVIYKVCERSLFQKNDYKVKINASLINPLMILLALCISTLVYSQRWKNCVEISIHQQLPSNKFVSLAYGRYHKNYFASIAIEIPPLHRSSFRWGSRLAFQYYFFPAKVKVNSFVQLSLEYQNYAYSIVNHRSINAYGATLALGVRTAVFRHTKIFVNVGISRKRFYYTPRVSIWEPEVQLGIQYSFAKKT